jgi:hypothetical protein
MRYSRPVDGDPGAVPRRFSWSPSPRRCAMALTALGGPAAKLGPSARPQDPLSPDHPGRPSSCGRRTDSRNRPRAFRDARTRRGRCGGMLPQACSCGRADCSTLPAKPAARRRRHRQAEPSSNHPARPGRRGPRGPVRTGPQNRTAYQLSANANELMARHRWRTVDVSCKAIEEVAKEMAGLRGCRLRIPQ